MISPFLIILYSHLICYFWQALPRAQSIHASISAMVWHSRVLFICHDDVHGVALIRNSYLCKWLPIKLCHSSVYSVNHHHLPISYGRAAIYFQHALFTEPSPCAFNLFLLFYRYPISPVIFFLLQSLFLSV